MSIHRTAVEDIWLFSGDGAMENTISATITTDQSRGSVHIARITCSGHGYEAGSLIYLQGFSNSIYNGIHKIDAVATNTFDILLGRIPFAAITPGGSETAKPIVTCDECWELLGFELHLSAAASTSEDFTALVDADYGAALDSNLYTRDMSGMQDIVQNYAQPRPLAANDLLEFAYTNTDGRTWGLKVITRRIA